MNKEYPPALMAECATELLDILPTAMPATCDAQEARKYRAGRATAKRRVAKYRKEPTMDVKAHKQLCDAVDWLTRWAHSHGALSGKAHTEMLRVGKAYQRKVHATWRSGSLGDTK